VTLDVCNSGEASTSIEIFRLRPTGLWLEENVLFGLTSCRLLYSRVNAEETDEDVDPDRFRRVISSAGILWTTIDELCEGFSWISIVLSTLVFRLLLVDCPGSDPLPSVFRFPTSSFTGDGISWGDGDDQSLGFFRIPGRFNGGDVLADGVWGCDGPLSSW